MTLPWFKEGELICPICAAPLTFCDEGVSCLHGHLWLVDSGVANLTPRTLSRAVQTTIDSFAFKWAVDPRKVFEERSRVGTFWFYDRFKSSLPRGETDFRDMLAPKGRLLDVGCGLGNMTLEMARLAPQAQVWGVDLTPVAPLFTKLHGNIPNVRLVQGDIRNLPIAGTFDLILADGVLHHTTDTRTSLLGLAGRLNPGGDFLFYVYKRKAPVREFTDDWLREHTTQMVPEECMEFCRALTDLGRQLRAAQITLRFEKPIPLLGIQAGEIDLQRWVYWHLLKCFWDDGGNELAAVVENFDWYHPPIAHRHTLEEVQEWLEEAGLKVIQLVAADSGISVWGHREM